MAGVAGFEPTNDGVRARILLSKTVKKPYFKYFLYQFTNHTQVCAFFLEFKYY